MITGNIESLKTTPASQGVDLYEHLQMFHSRYYSSHFMTLAVQAKGIQASSITLDCFPIALFIKSTTNQPQYIVAINHEFRWLMYIVHNHCIAQWCMTLVTEDCVLCPSILLCLDSLPENHIRKWYNLFLTFDPLPIKLVVESLTLSQSFWTNLYFYRDIGHSGDLGPRHILSCTTQVSLDTS